MEGKRYAHGFVCVYPDFTRSGSDTRNNKYSEIELIIATNLPAGRQEHEDNKYTIQKIMTSPKDLNIINLRF
jgi:hypothetical protein